MVYGGRGDTGQRQLWVRRWDALEATPIRNTDAANAPAISPDGREVAFVLSGSIRVVPLEGGGIADPHRLSRLLPKLESGG